jgi:hypothetical protein
MVFYSPDGDRPDGERRFIPLAVDQREMTLGVNLNNLPGGSQAFFRVFATDNRGQTAVVDSAFFPVATKPPRVSIHSPQPGSAFAQGTAILLRGDFDDLEDMQLPPEAFLWSSDRDGFLGRGPTIGTSNLSPGQHVITLAITDSDGLTGYAQVALSMRIPCDIDGNNSVDRNDVNTIFAARNTQVTPADLRDVDGDGVVTVNDARLCTLRCSNARCAP